MYLCHGTYTSGNTLLCIMLAQITASISKKLSLPGVRGEPLENLSHLQCFSVYVCVWVCVCSFKCFIDSSKGKKVLQTILDHLEMTENIQSRKKNHLIPMIQKTIIYKGSACFYEFFQQFIKKSRPICFHSVLGTMNQFIREYQVQVVFLFQEVEFQLGVDDILLWKL